MLIKAKVRPFQSANSPSLRGFAVVNIRTPDLGDIIIRDVSLMHSQKNDDFFISLPQKRYTAKDGKERYQDIVQVSEDIKAAIHEAVLSGYSEAMKKESVPA